MSSAKRPRLESYATHHRRASSSIARRYTMDTLPPEVLEMVFKMLPKRHLAESVRLVSRRCSTVCTSVLNAAFLGVEARLDGVMNHVEAAMLRVTSRFELLGCSKIFNALEIVRAQYRMLRAVTWRYTHPPRRNKSPRVCFYGGILLDQLNRFIRSGRSKPATLATAAFRDTVISRFVSLCKMFMNYFEKVSENRINRSPLTSGCKVVDVLDCLAEGRQVLAFRAAPEWGFRSGAVTMRLKYVLRRAWFTCLRVPAPSDENCWHDEQRFMYLRLRRLVNSVNEHFFEKAHYDRERLLRSASASGPHRPPSSTYSGYGEYGGQFFYYGNMNEYAFESKIKALEISDWEDPENPDQNEGLDDAEESHGTPSFDLVIVVELRCSPDLAPLAVRSALRHDALDEGVTNSRQEMFLKMNVTCPASVANRLPANFTWELRAP